MRVLLIASDKEEARQAHIASLKTQIPTLININACFPKYEHVPFLNKLISISKKRTGTALAIGEIGCLLSHRKAWQYIIKHADDNAHTLIIESDSVLKIDEKSIAAQNINNYDIFFWGAWEGHIQLFKSTKIKLNNGYTIGEPYIKTAYCTYGYSINKKAAKLLLQQTKKSSYPVDQFKKFIKQDTLKLGAVLPEMITTNNIPSSIRTNDLNSIRRRFFLKLLDLKNSIICYFK
jgi:GR25 family glycosyltransferase involved in LPS biosynthesis